MTAEAWLGAIPTPARVTPAASDAAGEPVGYGDSELAKACNHARRISPCPSLPVAAKGIVKRRGLWVTARPTR